MLIGPYASKIPETFNHDILQLAETAFKKDEISVLKSALKDKVLTLSDSPKKLDFPSDQYSECYVLNDMADVFSGNRLKAKINKYNLTGYFFISINQLCQ